MTRWWLCAASLFLLAIGTDGRAYAQGTLTVFAASSLTGPLERLASAAGARIGMPVRYSFAASSTIARQVDAGAGADIVMTADEVWMNYLADRKRLEFGTRVSILGNRLVLVVPADRPCSVTLNSHFNLVGLLGRGRLAIGDPVHVPAGTYAREALMTLGLWVSVERSLAPADSARAALALVERGETPAGIVYESDAALSSRVMVAGTFPESSHRPIVYDVAIVAGRDTPAARGFLAFLRSPEARAWFTASHFSVK